MTTQDLQNKLNQFISDYTGKANVGNTPENTGQCVGLVSVWQDILGVSHEYGNAIDFLKNADLTKFQVIINQPTNAPVPGDIAVFGSNWGNGLGHVGVTVTADVNSLTLFEQNDPDGSTPHQKTYEYGGMNDVLGWLHFITDPVQSTDSNIITLPSGATLDYSNKASMIVAANMWDAVVNSHQYVSVGDYNALQGQVKNETEQVTSMQDQNQLLLNKQADLQKQLQDLQSKYDEASKELASTNSSLQALTSSNYDYGAKALDAEHLANDRMSYIKAIADAAKVPETTDEKALVEEILNEIAALEKNEPSNEEALNLWEQHFYKIVDNLLKNGLNDYLKANNLKIVDLDNNPQDVDLADKVISFLDDTFHRLSLTEKAQQQIAKARPFLIQLGDSLYGMGVKMGLFTKRPNT